MLSKYFMPLGRQLDPQREFVTMLSNMCTHKFNSNLFFLATLLIFVGKVVDCEVPLCSATACVAIATNSTFGGGEAASCSSLATEYDEIFREACTTSEGGEGERVFCCPKNSTSELLQTMYGAEKNEFPHMASVGPGSCGGTIYNSKFILTAAHCVLDEVTQDAQHPFEVNVTLGSNLKDGLDDENSTFEVEQVFLHENFSSLFGHPELEEPLRSQRLYNDIALLRLKKNITFGRNVKALKMAPEVGFEELDFGEDAIVVGWGRREDLPAQGLYKTNFPIRDGDTCFSSGGTWDTYEALRDQLLCIGGIVNGSYGVDTNAGDSGGPAICRDPNGTAVLCGIVSFGSPRFCWLFPSEVTCRKPAVFAKVTYFQKWIVSLAGEQDPNSFQPYLFGKPVPPKKYRSQVDIKIYGNYNYDSCGGTLISQDTILTAAHCWK